MSTPSPPPPPPPAKDLVSRFMALPLKTMVFTSQGAAARLAKERQREEGLPSLPPPPSSSSSAWASSSKNKNISSKNHSNKNVHTFAKICTTTANSSTGVTSTPTTTTTTTTTNSFGTKSTKTITTTSMTTPAGRSPSSAASSSSGGSMEEIIETVKAAFASLPPLQGDNDVMGLKALLLLIAKSIIFSASAHYNLLPPSGRGRSGGKAKAALQSAIHGAALAKISSDKQWYYRHMCHREGVSPEVLLSLRKFVQDEVIWYCRMYNSGLLGAAKEEEEEEEEEEKEEAAEEGSKEEDEEEEEEDEEGDDDEEGEGKEEGDELGGDDGGDGGWVVKNVKKKKEEKPRPKAAAAVKQQQQQQPQQLSSSANQPRKWTTQPYQSSMVCGYCHQAGHGRGGCLERNAVLCMICLGWGHNRNHCHGQQVRVTLADIASHTATSSSSSSSS